MFPPSRKEIEQFITDSYAVAVDDILAEYATERGKVMRDARFSGNSGASLPALTACEAEKAHKMMLAWADAYVDAFTTYGVPCDHDTEADLRMTATQVAGGAISSIQDDFELEAQRTGRHRHVPLDYVNHQIWTRTNSALKNGLLKVKRQRIQFSQRSSEVHTSKEVAQSINEVSALPAYLQGGEMSPINNPPSSGRGNLKPRMAGIPLSNPGSANQPMAAEAQDDRLESLTSKRRAAFPPLPPQTEDPVANPKRVSLAGQVPERSLSARDELVHGIIGGQSFATLTNGEIMRDRRLRRRLRDECNLRTPNSMKCCLDRVRRLHGYDLSREISKKRSSTTTPDGQKRSKQLPNK